MNSSFPPVEEDGFRRSSNCFLIVSLWSSFSSADSSASSNSFFFLGPNFEKGEHDGEAEVNGDCARTLFLFFLCVSDFNGGAEGNNSDAATWFSCSFELSECVWTNDFVFFFVWDAAIIVESDKLSSYSWDWDGASLEYGWSCFLVCCLRFVDAGALDRDWQSSDKGEEDGDWDSLTPPKAAILSFSIASTKVSIACDLHGFQSIDGKNSLSEKFHNFSLKYIFLITYIPMCVCVFFYLRQSPSQKTREKKCVSRITKK